MYRIIADGLDRDVWLKGREGGVTATDVARLARGGAGTWAAVRAEKNGRGRDFRNAAMQHGIDREPIIAEFARANFGLTHSRALLAANDEPYFLATPDGIGEDSIGEYKTTVHDWHRIEDAPARYIDQMFWQMRVTGRRKAVLVFEPHENGVPLYPFPKHFILDYDPARVAELEAVAQEFRAGAQQDDELAAELDALLTARMEAKEVAEITAGRVESLEDQIRTLLDGKPTKFEGSLANLTLSAAGSSDRFDSVAFKTAQPDLYKTYVKATASKPRLTITARSN